MLKSFTNSIRSFLHTESNEAGQSPERKRKRSSVDTEDDDSDVEIVAVKKPRKEASNSSPGFFSMLALPMHMMSEWVRRKVAYQDPFHSRPVHRDSDSWRNSDVGREVERQRLLPASTPTSSRVASTNGGSLQSYTQGADSLTRPSIHIRNEAGMNGDMCSITRQPTAGSSAQSSRRSSISSSRAGYPSRRSTVEQCYQLKEREEYLKLLQQHTTVDLGYHGHRTGPSVSQQHVANHDHKMRRPATHPPVPYSNSSQLSGSFGSEPSRQASRIRATPNRVLQASSSLSSYAKEELNMSSAADIFLVPRIPGRVVPVHSTPLSRRTLKHKEQTESESGQQRRQEPEGDSARVPVTRLKAQSQSSLDFKSSEYLDDQWLQKMQSKYSSSEKERQLLIKEAEIKKRLLEERRQGKLGNLDKKLREQMRLFDEEPEVIEETPLPEVPQEKELPPLTDEMERTIKAALDGGPPTQVLVEGFRLQITKGDMATLKGLNWLNDEVINFYMNLLMERGEQEGFDKTYTFNTFFYPKLVSGGHSAVRRWTRKVDLFSYHYLVIPVHLGVHWCLCVVFMKQKKICYYDSMGGNNDQCLNAVRQYLYDESMEKKKEQLDLSEWTTEVVKDIPQQMNGSDCGMFSCMYAESITRGAKITFTQKDMPYFRRRMVYEILKKKLL